MPWATNEVKLQTSLSAFHSNDPSLSSLFPNLLLFWFPRQWFRLHSRLSHSRPPQSGYYTHRVPWDATHNGRSLGCLPRRVLGGCGYLLHISTPEPHPHGGSEDLAVLEPLYLINRAQWRKPLWRAGATVTRWLAEMRVPTAFSSSAPHIIMEAVWIIFTPKPFKGSLEQFPILFLQLQILLSVARTYDLFGGESEEMDCFLFEI